MTCYFRKPDTIVVGLSLSLSLFFPKIAKYRLHNIDSSSLGVALSLIKGAKSQKNLNYISALN